MLSFQKGHFRNLALVLSYILLTSCTPQQRLSRMMKRHPELFQADTIYRSDTVRITGTKADTVFAFSQATDTVVLDSGRLQVKYYYTHDSVFLSGQCRDSMIIRQVPFKIITPAKAVEKIPVWAYMALGGLITSAGALFIMLFSRSRRPP